jgi:xylan 1,4-beta-xylosidase
MMRKAIGPGLIVPLMALLLKVSVINAQLVLPGDFPDPSVTKVGNTYWASATTSNWAPAYPLLSSSDLVHWEQRGVVFPTLPAWADYYFWAPEISHENGKTYIYYAAHKKGGNLCLGVASADKPEGPYRDHGPIMCQEVGSIDAFPMRDENGKLFLIWKEDGNSVGKPTPIWMAEMNEDRSGLSEDKKELFRNDAPWESNLVEGVSMIRHGEYFYAFYAAAGCCGRDCTYATGVARSRKLGGPWEKFSGNPLLTHTKEWRCPGHGTPVEMNGKYYFLYHAYHNEGGVYAGRQGLLMEFEFSADGWIRFLPVKFPSVKPVDIKEEFDSKEPTLNWQWSVFQSPKFNHGNGRLQLNGGGGNDWTYIGHKSYTANYRARTTINLSSSTATSGLALIGDEKNMVAVSVDKEKIRVWKTRMGKDTLVAEENVLGDRLFLEMKVDDGSRITFRCSTNGKSFKNINRRPIDGAFLPPWDRALRIGLLSKGTADQMAVYENFILYH